MLKEDLKQQQQQQLATRILLVVCVYMCTMYVFYAH